MRPDCFPLPRHVNSADLPAGWERQLLARISDGDSDALLDLRWRWGEWLCGRVYHITDDWMAASFLTAGVFMRLWRAPADFDSGRLRHSLLLLAEQRAYQWLASRADSRPVQSISTATRSRTGRREDIDMAGSQDSEVDQRPQEKSTNQLAVWWRLVDLLGELESTWQDAQPVVGASGTSQLPANVAAALARAGRAGAEVTAGVAAVLAEQADTGGAFRDLAVATRQASAAWPIRATRS